MDHFTITRQGKDIPYEERIAAIQDLGIATHEIRVKAPRFGVNETIECSNEDQAYFIAHNLVDAARELHDEEMDRYGCFEPLTFDEFLSEGGWKIEVYELFPRELTALGLEGNNISRKKRFMFGHRMGASKMANPKSKVFLSISGRDCDNARWSITREFPDLFSAHAYVEEEGRHAEGPWGWSCISRDDYEMSQGCNY